VCARRNVVWAGVLLRFLGNSSRPGGEQCRLREPTVVMSACKVHAPSLKGHHSSLFSHVVLRPEAWEAASLGSQHFQCFHLTLGDPVRFFFKL
jgi:hypothetical protein